MESEKEAKPDSDLDLLCKLVFGTASKIELFSWQGEGFASVPAGGGGVEAVGISSRGFRAWLRREFLDVYNRRPSLHAMRTAINEIAEQAVHEKEKRIFRRVGTDGKDWFIDLGNEEREVIEIHQGYWQRKARATIPFVRISAMRPFPAVSKGCYVDGKTDLIPVGRANRHRKSFKAFGSLLNIHSANDLQLVMAWCVCALTPEGPYPVLTVGGEQGSAKSTLVRLIHELVDPSHALLRTMPSSEKDLFISAANAHLLAFDNVSSLSASTSDNLCKLSTGGAVAMRRIGTESDQIYLEFKTPVILNGIGDLILRPDLADRAVFINTTAIPDGARRDVWTIDKEFRELAPALTEALLDMLAQARRQLMYPISTKLPRMAEFARIGIAIEDLFGAPGSFMAAYDKNRAAATDELAELDPILTTILELWDEKNCWSGTMQDLQYEIAQRSKAAGSRIAAPTGLAQMSSHVKRITPLLIKKGLNVAFHRATSKDRRRTLSLF